MTPAPCFSEICQSVDGTLDGRWRAYRTLSLELKGQGGGFCSRRHGAQARQRMEPGGGNLSRSRGGVGVKPAFEGSVHAIYATTLQEAATASIEGWSGRTSSRDESRVELAPTMLEGPAGKGMEGWTVQTAMICSCGGFSECEGHWIFGRPRVTTGRAPLPLLTAACERGAGAILCDMARGVWRVSWKGTCYASQRRHQLGKQPCDV